MLSQEQVNLGYDWAPPGVNVVNYPWMLFLHSLTSLHLTTNWKWRYQVQHGIIDIAQQLQQLRSLALDNFILAPRRKLAWAQLAPLAQCTLLTQLDLNLFALGEPEDEWDDVEDEWEDLEPQPQVHLTAAGGTAAGTGDHGLCLPSLRRLCISSAGSAVWRHPLSRFAPHLTELQHVSKQGLG
jgi:hypothetical protein